MSELYWRVACWVSDAEDHLFSRMQRNDYDRASGERALLNNGESALADKWTSWWDAGDE